MSGKLGEALIHVRAPAWLVKALDAEAKRRAVSKSAVVRLALVRELDLPSSMPEMKGHKRRGA